MSPAKLLERLVHPHGDPGDGIETETPKEVLEALEGSDADSGRDLVEKANGLNGKSLS